MAEIPIPAYGDTGVVFFSGLSFNSNTTIDIGMAIGVISDNESFSPVRRPKIVEYAGETNVTVPTLGSGTATYVLLDGNEEIIFQNTFPTSAERKSMIWLGKIGHPAGTINVVINEPDFILSPHSQFRDFFQAVNYVNDGVLPFPNGANLTVNVSAGKVIGNGINFVNDRTTPNDLNVGPFSPVSFLYRTQTGGNNTFITTVDPANYDVGGVVTTIGGSVFNTTLQRLYCVPGGGFIIQYGQIIYSNLDEALLEVGREQFVIFPNLPKNSILIGVIALIRSATELNNTAQARIIHADKFGQER